MPFDPPTQPATPEEMHREISGLLGNSGQLRKFLLSGLLDGLWYWDVEDPALGFISPTFWRLLDLDPETMGGSPQAWQDHMYFEDLSAARHDLQRHYCDPDCPFDLIARFRHPKGTPVWLRCQGTALRDSAGRPRRMLVVLNDLTDIKRAEVRAVEKKQELEKINSELRTLSYGISHDLKAPVSTARMLLRELCDLGLDGLCDEQRDLLCYAYGTLDRMVELIENVLRYARLVSAPRDVEVIDTDALVAAIVSDLRASIADTRAEVVTGHLPNICGNPVQIRSLFQNLVENALKFHRKDVPPQVKVRGWSIDGRVRFEVADNGIGIEKRFHQKIFDMFARLHNQDDYLGSGLGLAACAKVVANHGGEIGVSSSPNRGSTFHVTFPQDVAK